MCGWLDTGRVDRGDGAVWVLTISKMPRACACVCVSAVVGGAGERGGLRKEAVGFRGAGHPPLSTWKLGNLLIFILWLRKQRHREAEILPWGCTAAE